MPANSLMLVLQVGLGPGPVSLNLGGFTTAAAVRVQHGRIGAGSLRPSQKGPTFPLNFVHGSVYKQCMYINLLVLYMSHMFPVLSFIFKSTDDIYLLIYNFKGFKSFYVRLISISLYRFGVSYKFRVVFFLPKVIKLRQKQLGFKWVKNKNI